MTGRRAEKVYNPSVVLFRNTPLTGGQTVTSESEQNEEPTFGFFCYTDVAGTLYVEFSPNDEDWFVYPTSGFVIKAGIPSVHSAVKFARHMRYRFVNGSADQTEILLYFYYGQFPQLISPLNQAVTRDADASVVRMNPPEDEIVLNQRTGVTKWNKFGYRDDIDTADGNALVIADDTTNTPTIITTASTYTITYNSGTDGSGRNGALTIAFFHLDSDGIPETQIHTLGSTGSDETSFSGLGINRAAVATSGSSDSNVNDITITATTGSSVQAFIPAGESVTQQALFHVRSDGIGVIKAVRFNALKLSGGGTPRVTFRGWIYSRTADTTYEVLKDTIDTSVENTVLYPNYDFRLNAFDVFYITAGTTVDNTPASVKFSVNEYANG